MNSCLPVNFKRIESQIEGICCRAEEQLKKILSDERFHLYMEAEKKLPTTQSVVAKSNNSLASFELRLGSTKLSLEELQTREVNDIVPLPESEKGLIEIWFQGKRRGKGVLLVVNGKLAVKIEEI